MPLRTFMYEPNNEKNVNEKPAIILFFDKPVNSS